jgi:hypothetical protein
MNDCDLADNAAHLSRSSSWGRVVAGCFLLWAILYGLLLLVYSKALRAGLIYDDVAMLLYFNEASNFQWYNSFRPMDNGFIRPIYMFTYWVTSSIAGLNPLVYRLHSAAIHAAVAVAAGVASCRLLRISWMAGAIVSLSVALASAAFVTVFYYSNTGDSYMALGMLAAVYCCDRWLKGGAALWLAGTFAALAFSIASKETGVAVGGILALQVWASGRRDLHAWTAAAAALAICGGWAVTAMLIQRHNELSYYHKGYSTNGTEAMIKRIFRYLAATLFPGSFVLKPLWNWGQPIATALNNGLWCTALGGTILSAWAVGRKRCSREILVAGVLMLGAAGMLLPTAAVALEAGPHSPIGRYLYASLVLVMMAAGGLGAWLYRTHKLWWRAGCLVWSVWLVMQVVIIRKSPGTEEYYETAKEWKALAKEMGRLSPKWPALRALTVYTGPEHGSFRLDDAYGTALMRLYYPKLLMVYISNREIPETGCRYIFDGRKLQEIK